LADVENPEAAIVAEMFVWRSRRDFVRLPFIFRRDHNFDVHLIIMKLTEELKGNEIWKIEDAHWASLRELVKGKLSIIEYEVLMGTDPLN
jgi:hypothetical protein